MKLARIVFGLLVAALAVGGIASLIISIMRNTGRSVLSNESRNKTDDATVPPTEERSRELLFRSQTRPSATAFTSSSGERQSAAKLLPERVRPIVTLKGMEHGSARFKAVRSLPSNLSDEEIRSLYEFLRAKGPQTQPDRMYEHALKNEVLNKLRNLQPAPPAFTELLISIHQDKHQDLVIRDYALQHLRFWYPNASTEEKEQIAGVFWQALTETGNSIAGTALLSLHGLARTNPEFDQQRIAEAALHLARDQRSGPLARISAVQVCGQMGLREVLPAAMELAQGSESYALRLAAIATLGDVGGPETISLLQHLATEEDSLLQNAAQSALDRLVSRISGRSQHVVQAP
jgi:hypothetical protein